MAPRIHPFLMWTQQHMWTLGPRRARLAASGITLASQGMSLLTTGPKWTVTPMQKLGHISAGTEGMTLVVNGTYQHQSWSSVLVWIVQKPYQNKDRIDIKKCLTWFPFRCSLHRELPTLKYIGYCKNATWKCLPWRHRTSLWNSSRVS